jgi:hypothetical protein
MINDTNVSVKLNNENFYEVFLNILTIKIITTFTFGFFDKSVWNSRDVIAIN